MDVLIPRLRLEKVDLGFCLDILLALVLAQFSPKNCYFGLLFSSNARDMMEMIRTFETVHYMSNL